MAPVPLQGPPLMVIGDSLAQGARSLTVKAAFCAQSWPARLAASQGWEFRTPDFPRPVLFDLEDEVRRLDTLTLSVNNLRFRGIVGRVRDNLRAWLVNARESAFPCFDNLGLSGALIHDLYTRSAATSQTEIETLAPNGADSNLALDQFGALHLAVNGRFTLNPGQDPAFQDFTPLDWVRQRKPRTLLVQIGHNHGLYAIGANAADGGFDQGDDVHGDYWHQWQTLAAHLGQLPAEVGTIVVALLPRIGAVANLAPQGDDRTNGYASAYEPVFSTSTSQLSGARLAAIDADLRAANDRIKTTLGGVAGLAGRLKFLDTYALLDRFDYKNSLDEARRVVVSEGVEVDNRYLSGRFHLPPPLGPGFTLRTGGIASIDGMHPSGCGYAQLAQEALKLLGLGNAADSLLAQAFADDTLLSDYPVELDVVVRLLAALRDLRHVDLFVPSPAAVVTEEPHLSDALRMMQSVFMPRKERGPQRAMAPMASAATAQPAAAVSRRRRGNGMTPFAFHKSQRQAVTAALTASVGGKAALQPKHMDAETAALLYVKQTLASPDVPEFTAQEARGKPPEFKSLGVEKLPLTGTQTVKFRQYYRGIPVYGSLVTVELDENQELLAINSAVGTPDVNPVAEVSVAQAVAIIKHAAGYPPRVALDLVPKLCYYFAPELNPPQWVLAYVAEDVPRYRPPDLKREQHYLPEVHDYVVCAHTGNLVAELPRTMTAAPPGPEEWEPDEVQWKDDLGRFRQLRVLSKGTLYRFHDNVLNIKTHDFGFHDIDLHASNLPGTLVEGSLPPPPWLEGVVSAHANAADVARFFREVLQRNGVDNKGGTLLCSVRCCSVYNGGQAQAWHNAAWYRSQMVYGQRRVTVNGRDEYHSFARSPEVVAHEIMHGVTNQTARLQYMNETGALNESYSDIFGILITNFNEPNRAKWDWTMGSATNEGVPLRDLANPGKGNPPQPGHMRDYADTTADNGGVHTNSGIHNKAFYNLAMAGDGSGGYLIDNRSLAALFYYGLTQHLTPTSRFADSRRAVLLTAQTLFRNDDDALRDRKLAAIAKAFDDVGITEPPAGNSAAST